MGYSLAEKILKAHLKEGTLEKGSEIGITVDQCLTQDSTGTMAWLEFESLMIDKVKSKVAVSYCDHTSLGFKGESTDDHLFLQSIAQKFGAVYSKQGNGVCHQVHYERFGIPGNTLLGSDSHTPTAGGIGMMGIGVGGMDVAVALSGGLFYLKAPEIMKVNLSGNLPLGVNAKDIILELLRRISVKGGVGKIIEYGGAGIKQLSIPQRATITNMGAETGATTSIFPADEVTRKFFADEKRKEDWRELLADDDAQYDKVIDIDLAQLLPLVAMPFSPDNVQTIEEVKGTKVDQIVIGSCTNGSYGDLKITAQMLKGKKISSEVDLIIVPGSRQVEQMLLRDGSFADFIEAGARVIEPGCGPCIGMGFVPGSGSLSLRTVNRNWPGRGGNKEAKLALCSAETAVASALKGVVADPREIFKISLKNDDIDYIKDDTLLVFPAKAGNKEIRRSKNIVPLKPQTPPESVLKGEVLLKVKDGISTDDILPAGPLTQHLRSNLPKIAEYTYHYIDSGFVKRAKETGGGFIVGGENYGQGSSREHAALVKKELNIKGVIAKSLARIHRTNLINCGVIPLFSDTDQIEAGDELAVDISCLRKGQVSLNNISKNKELQVSCDLSPRETEIVLAGGILAYTKALAK